LLDRDRERNGNVLVFFGNGHVKKHNSHTTASNKSTPYRKNQHGALPLYGEDPIHCYIFLKLQEFIKGFNFITSRFRDFHFQPIEDEECVPFGYIQVYSFIQSIIITQNSGLKFGFELLGTKLSQELDYVVIISVCFKSNLQRANALAFVRASIHICSILQ
jgi:hypothetical protein